MPVSKQYFQNSFDLIQGQITRLAKQKNKGVFIRKTYRTFVATENLAVVCSKTQNVDLLRQIF